jgi:hypothetical protein
MTDMDRVRSLSEEEPLECCAGITRKGEPCKAKLVHDPREEPTRGGEMATMPALGG